MSQRWIAVALLFVAAPLLGLEAIPSRIEPAATARVAPPPPPDTLRANATTGTPLILSLPATLRDTPVTRYTVLRAPALCGVAGRSFTWIPKNAAPGSYEAALHAHHPDAEPDTLVVQIELSE